VLRRISNRLAAGGPLIPDHPTKLLDATLSPPDVTVTAVATGFFRVRVALADGPNRAPCCEPATSCTSGVSTAPRCGALPTGRAVRNVAGRDGRLLSPGAEIASLL
jgi:hypothetical protein